VPKLNGNGWIDGTIKALSIGAYVRKVRQDAMCVGNKLG